MNLKLVVVAIVSLVVSIVLFCINIKQKNRLDNCHTIKGTIIKYKRNGRFIYPVIEFIEKGEKKEIVRGGVINYKPLKVGSEVRLLKKENGKYLTDSDVKFVQYYAVTLLIGFVFFLVISFIV